METAEIDDAEDDDVSIRYRIRMNRFDSQSGVAEDRIPQKKRLN